MKIISLSSTIAGPACGVACSIKKYFYNNTYMTNIFDYLEISLLSINQILYMKEDDINYLSSNNTLKKNIDGAMTVKFENFDKIYSHHDLHENYTEEDYNNFIEKYKRRYLRFINDIKNENKIFFIRFGFEDIATINQFIDKIYSINNNLEIYFINIFYDEHSEYDIIQYKADNIIFFNFYDYIKPDFAYSDNLFNKIMEFNWDVIYDFIFNNLNEDEKNIFRVFRLGHI